VVGKRDIRYYRRVVNRNFFTYNKKFHEFMWQHRFGLYFLLLFLFFFKPFSIIKNFNNVFLKSFNKFSKKFNNLNFYNLKRDYFSLIVNTLLDFIVIIKN
jgi:hypothetical protein